MVQQQAGFRSSEEDAALEREEATYKKLNVGSRFACDEVVRWRFHKVPPDVLQLVSLAGDIAIVLETATFEPPLLVKLTNKFNFVPVANEHTAPTLCFIKCGKVCGGFVEAVETSLYNKEQNEIPSGWTMYSKAL